MRECGKCLLDAMELGRCVLHRSGEEGIDELWGEPFRAFSIPLEDFYESRYIKIGQTLRDIDKISRMMIDTFSGIPAFADIEGPVCDLATAAKIKTETLRTDRDIFDVWARMVTAGERLALPGLPRHRPGSPSCRRHCRPESFKKQIPRRTGAHHHRSFRCVAYADALSPADAEMTSISRLPARTSPALIWRLSSQPQFARLFLSAVRDFPGQSAGCGDEGCCSVVR
jgi:hypothetical protein